ncbi:hypothetical protein VNI00_018750 [Paramarasmius palmivorus]|uniref:Ribonuclease H1 N-terminal domain-containing protein n=1 Tax=Paramarasmius palmivorus TaxID=297713 RepID=A0AAW0AXS2_9AGAR
MAGLPNVSNDPDSYTARPPSPIDRREGSIVIGGGNNVHSNPRTYTYTQHEPGRGVTIVKTTTEEHAGLVITNITKIQRRHPDVTPVAEPPRSSSPQARLDSSHAVVISDDSSDDETSIPHPGSLQPFLAERYYVVFKGTRVGIFARWNTDALKYTEGVSGAKHHSYKTWNEALLEYSRAFHGKKAGWELECLNGPLALEDEDPIITSGLQFTSHKTR